MGAFLKQVLKLFCFSIQWEEAVYIWRNSLRSGLSPEVACGAVAGASVGMGGLLPPPGRAAALHAKGPNPVALRTCPDVFIFSETWFFYNVKACLPAALFSLTVLPTWDIQDGSGCGVPPRKAGLWASVSRMVFPKLLTPKPAPRAYLTFPWTSLLTFPYLLTSYFPGFYPRGFSPPSASFAPLSVY